MKYFIIIFSLFAIGCTNNSTPKAPEEAKEVVDREINIAPLSLSSLNISVEDENLEFGSLSPSLRESTRIIKITNNGTGSASFNIDDSALINGFTIKVNRCLSTLASNASCNLTLSFKSRGLFDGIKHSTLLLSSGQNSVSLNLSGQVTGNPNPQSIGVGNLQLVLENPFEEDGLPYREIQVKNIGSGTAKNIQFQLTQEFSIRLNRCPAELEPGKECRVQVLLKNWRQNPPIPEKVLMVYSESGVSNSVSEKQVDLASGSTGDFVQTYTGTYSVLPTNNKTEICSGTSTYQQQTLSCVNYFGQSVDSSNCAAGQSVTYNSPAGVTQTESISNGSRSFGCLGGSDDLIFFAGNCNSGFTYQGTNLGTCEPNIQLSAAACENGYEGEDCQISASGGIEPYSYQIDNSTGGASISSSGLLNPSGVGSTTVTVSDSAGASRSVTISSIRRLYSSCDDIKTNIPSTNTDGLYMIDPDGIRNGESRFEVICDMTLHGGGWTLLMSGQQNAGVNMDGNVTFYQGTNNTVSSFSVMGFTITNAALQKVVRTVKFSKLKLGGADTYSSNWYVINSSLPNTSFSQKYAGKASNTWTSVAESGLLSCSNIGWDRYRTGTYTVTQASLGCQIGQDIYGDHYFVGLGIAATSTGINGDAGCGPSGLGGSYGTNVGNMNCGPFRYLVGYVRHKAVYNYGQVGYAFGNITPSAKHRQVWVK